LLAGSLALGSAPPSLAQENTPPATVPQPAQKEPAAPAVKMLMGYVELVDDPRYDEDRAEAEIPVRPLGRPFDATAVGISDAEQIGKVIGVDFAIERKSGQKDRKSTRLNSSHVKTSYAVFCLKKKKTTNKKI